MVFEHMIDDSEKRVCNSDYRSFLSPSASQASVLGIEVRVFRIRCSPCRLSKSVAEPFATLGRLAALVFVGATVIARADPGPRIEVVRRRKLAHIAADFSYHVLSPTSLKAGQAHHLLNCFGERAAHLLDPLAEQIYLPVQVIELINQLAQHEPVVVSYMPLKSKAKLGDFTPQLSSGELGHFRTVLTAFDKCPNHVHSRFTHDVGRNRPELYVGIFKNLVDPIYHRGSLIDQLGTMTSQVSKLPLGSIGDKAS